MSVTTADSGSPAGRAFLANRGDDPRAEVREPASFDVWMIDHDGSTVLKCHCDNASTRGLHLIAPLGYGIAEGQRYELRSHAPGVMPLPGFGMVGRRWARVVRTEIAIGERQDHLGVGLEFEAPAQS